MAEQGTSRLDGLDGLNPEFFRARAKNSGKPRALLNLFHDKAVKDGAAQSHQNSFAVPGRGQLEVPRLWIRNIHAA